MSLTNRLTNNRLMNNEMVQGEVAWRTQDVLLVIGGSLLLALSAQVAVPFPLVPLTLQPLALLLLGAALGPSRASLAAVAYLMEGAIGLPVFADLSGGAHVFAGPTAGYLLAFPLTAAIAGVVTFPRYGRNVVMRIITMLAAIAVCYVGGWSWLAGPLHLGATKAFIAGVVPFFPADAVKALIAALSAPFAKELVQKFSR